jgi:hypothetical protein
MSETRDRANPSESISPSDIQCAHCNKSFKSRNAYFLHYRRVHNGIDPPIQKLKPGPKPAPKLNQRRPLSVYAEMSNEEKAILLAKRKIKRREKSTALYLTKTQDELIQILTRLIDTVKNLVEIEEMKLECHYLYNQAIISSDIIRSQFWPINHSTNSVHHATLKSAQARISTFKEKHYIMLFNIEVVSKAYLAKVDYPGIEISSNGDLAYRYLLDSFTIPKEVNL